ncbi:MFS transporter [Intrasporangium sp.]|uniref:MFS transporter n=1 Tax=Intrasporangium sp. TaxID=1925024 RepID=UPI002D77B794|nr:MFS transporter [Intrasporangium sp.]
MPSYADALRVRGYLPIFLVGALSLWGDYIARVTIAGIVFERTRSPLATATTLAVSLLPAVFGRSLVGPVVDRLPYKVALVGSHVVRALCVIGLIIVVVRAAPLWSVFVLLVVLEAVGGAATASSMVMLTDLFEDRRLYARAIGLNALSEQFNQAIGLAMGGGLVALLGPRAGLLIDLASFVLGAVVLAVVVELRPVHGDRGSGVRGFLGDLRRAAGDLVRHPILARLLALSAVAALGVGAPEALAIPLAGSSGWGGLLMAAPVAGAVLGILLISRSDVHRQNALVMPLALAMPVPLLATAFQPPLAALAALWFVSGMSQCFMVPVQTTFTLVTAPELRGRIFSLAGAVSVAAAGLAYLGAGWVGQHTDPWRGVAICAGICLGLVALLGLTWPHRRLRNAVTRAYDGPSSASRAA